MIKQLQDAGVKVIACGQAMFGSNVKKEKMVLVPQVALYAQTELSIYQVKNYLYYSLSEGK
ncbi:MAG: DsrE family protein [Chitinophagales bacterium]